MPDTVRSGGVLEDDAEAVAEEFVAQATSAEDVGERARDEMVTEELGGPFLEEVGEADRERFSVEAAEEVRRAS